MWCRHGRAAHVGITGSALGGRYRRDDIDTRRSDVHVVHAIVGEARATTVLVDRAHRNHVGQLVARWVTRRAIDIEPAVARGRDEQDVRVAGGLNGVIQRLGITATAPRVVRGDQVDLLRQLQLRQVVDGFYRAGVVPPVAPRNLAEITLALGHTPKTPTPLFATAATVPATCVPWSSAGPS